MSEHFTQHTKQCKTTVIFAVLPVPFPFPERDNQPPFPVKRNGTRLPHVRQHLMQPTDHSFTPGFQHLTDISNPSCLSTSQLPYQCSQCDTHCLAFNLSFYLFLQNLVRSLEFHFSFFLSLMYHRWNMWHLLKVCNVPPVIVMAVNVLRFFFT